MQDLSQVDSLELMRSAAAAKRQETHPLKEVRTAAHTLLEDIFDEFQRRKEKFGNMAVDTHNVIILQRA